MQVIKPNLYSRFIKQSLSNNVYSGPGPYCLSFTKNVHYSYATAGESGDSSTTGPKAKRERKKRTRTTKTKNSNNKNTTEIDLNSSHEDLIDKYFSLTEKTGSPSYIFKDTIAEKLATKIIENRTDPSTPIIEYNPGPALLTRQLLKHGASQIIGIESKKDFLPFLEKIKETYGSQKTDFYHWDPFMGNIYDAKRMDRLHQNEISSFLLLKRRQWMQDPYASIVGIMNASKSQTFISLLQNLLSSKESIYSYGRPEIFLIVPVKNYRLMIVKDPTKASWTYGKVSALWNLFFDIEPLLELHKSDVFPPFSAKRRIRCESEAFGTVNKNSIYLVKIVPKKNLDEITNCSEEYSKFLIFLNQITKNKNHRLIPKLETLVSGSGLHLIRMGFNMLHLTGEIPPHSYLDIYRKLRDLPEFKESSLDAILSQKSV